MCYSVCRVISQWRLGWRGGGGGGGGEWHVTCQWGGGVKWTVRPTPRDLLGGEGGGEIRKKRRRWKEGENKGRKKGRREWEKARGGGGGEGGGEIRKKRRRWKEGENKGMKKGRREWEKARGGGGRGRGGGRSSEDWNANCDIIQICIVVCVVIRVTLTGSPTGWQGAERVSGDKWLMDRLRQTDRDGVARLRLQTSSGTLDSFHFPPLTQKVSTFVPRVSKKFMVEMFFFRQKLRPWEGFDQMSAFWSMFWFKPFRNFLRKITIFRNFDQWSEILSMSVGRPLSQGVCPSLALGSRIKSGHIYLPDIIKFAEYRATNVI